jgi:hypothetical protein
MGNERPRYDNFGNRVINQVEVANPDQYTIDNASLQGSDHIQRHMHPDQRQMADQNRERVPAFSDNESIQGLEFNSVPSNIVMKSGPVYHTNNCNSGVKTGHRKEFLLEGPSFLVLSKFSPVSTTRSMSSMRPIQEKTYLAATG